MENETVSVTEEDLKELKKLYEKTPKGGTFKFKGREVLKEYAKYMIEYLEKQLGISERSPTTRVGDESH